MNQKSELPVFYYLFLFFVSLASTPSMAQTTLISPTGAGGFELGNTFLANGWTVVNYAAPTNSNWYLSTAAPLNNGAYSFTPTGSRAAYISNNAGTNWQYNSLPVASTVHLYRDVSFPAGETAINLSFRLNVNGELLITNQMDVLYVYLCPTSLTPVTGSPAAGSAVPAWAGTGNAYLIGAHQLFGAGSGQTVNLQIPAALAGNCAANSDMRLVFTWKNDAVNGAEPPAAIDDISLTTTVPASPLTGAKTIGAGGDYPNLTAALTALSQNGQSGNLILELLQTYSSVSEIFPITLPPVCAPVVIRPDTGVTNVSIVSAGANATLSFNGVTNWTIDGRPGGLGSGKELTIENTNTGGVAINFINDSYADTVRYCKIKGVNTATTGGVVVFGTSIFPSGNGNDNHTLEYCDIGMGTTTPTNCIISNGSTTNLVIANSGVRILNNNIFDFFSSASDHLGILFEGRGTHGWLIQGNSFYETAPRNVTGGTTRFWVAIGTNGSNTNLIGNTQIIGNFIGGTAPNCGGTAMSLTGTTAVRMLRLTVAGAAEPTSIQGNTFQNISINTTSASTSQSVMSLITGAFNVGNITGNTIGSLSANGSINFTLNLTTTNIPLCGILAGTGTIDATTIRNNAIGGITAQMGSPATGSVNIRGISLQGTTGSYFVDNNIVGSPTQTNSILNNTTGQTHGIITFYGGTVPTNNIVSNNLVANITTTGTTATNALYGIYMQGSGTPPNSVGAIQILNNTVRNLTTSTAATNVATAGIIMNINSPGQLLANNTIHSIANVATATAGQATGIYFTGGTLATATYTKNLIHSLSIANSLGTIGVSGILAAAGTASYTNNMIRLGIDANGNSLTLPMLINGIYDVSLGGTFYHNSIYIGGNNVTSAAANNTFALNSQVVTNPRTFVNNIFYNARSNATTGGTHYAIQVGGTGLNPAGLSCNYNLYDAPNTGGVFGRYAAANVSSLGAWKTTVGTDQNSLLGNPQFVNPTGSSATLNLHISSSNPTPIEQAGYGGLANVVTDDYDNQVRNSLSPVDIGADAGNFIPAVADEAAPVIIYNNLPNTCALGTINLTANIVDNTGVETAAPDRPRIYFRKNAGTWFSQAGILSSGNALNGTWDFAITPATMGGVTNGDVIQYYVIAQDIMPTPNVGSTAMTAVATDVNSIITHPTVPFSFTITNVLSGTYDVGVGGDFTTLTAAVNAYNIACLAGPVTFRLTDANYSASETFPITILHNPDASSVNTLTIKPAAAVSPTIANSTQAHTLRMNGCNYITIDGSNVSNGTTRNLTITNTFATGTSVIWLTSASATDPALNNTLKNCLLIGNTGTSTVAGILAGSSAAIGNEAESPNHNTTIQNNSFTRVQNGIYYRGNGSTFDQNLQIKNNNFGNNIVADKLGFRGMLVGNAQNFVVSDNIIEGISSAPASTASMSGIQLAFSVQNGSIIRNKITDVKQNSTWGAHGIFFGQANNNANVTVANNMIGDIASGGFNNVTWQDNGYGMVFNSGGGYKCYHNTVYMNTNQTAGNPMAVNVTSSIVSPNAIDFRNNLLANVQTTQNRYVLYCAANSNVFSHMDYNDYWGAAGVNLGFLFANLATLPDIQAAFGGNANSLNIEPQFLLPTNPLDLHLVKGSGVNCGIKGMGTPISGILDDIDTDTRSVTQPGIGADEFPDKIVAAPIAPYVFCSGSTLDLNGFASGTAPMTFSWTSSTGFSSTLQNASIANAQPVNNGTYTFTVKDFYDCQKDSTQTYTVNLAAQASAGLPDTICGITPVTFNGSIGGSATSATWSGGFGSYSPSNSSPVMTYTPHGSELGTTVYLMLTTNDPDGAGPCNPISAPVSLTVNAPGVANAGPDLAFCGNNGPIAVVTNNLGTWTGGTGSFGNTTNPSTSYMAGTGETSANLIWTTVDPDGAGPCNAAADTLNVSFTPLPTADAGTDQTSCGLSTIQLGAAIGGSGTSGYWSGGSGLFSASTSTSSTYTIHSSEIGTTVTLAWTTDDPDGSGPCNATTDYVDITVNGYPNVVAPADNSVRVADYELTNGSWTTYYDNNATAANYCDDYVLISIENANSGGNNIGTVSGGLVVTLNASTGATKLTRNGSVSPFTPGTPYVDLGVDWWVMNRFWNVSPLNQPVNDLNVRFYFTQADVTPVQTAVPTIISAGDLTMYKINNDVPNTTNYDPNPQNYHQNVPLASPYSYDSPGYYQYASGATPTTTEWLLGALGSEYYAEFTIDRFSGGGGGGSGFNGALPVDLLEFSGHNAGSENVLNWKTARENGLHSFDVLRSTDNQTFVQLGNVVAHGDMYHSATYSFTDETPYKGINYYKLHMKDLDGSIAPSNTIQILVEGELHYSVYPSPAKDNLYVSLGGFKGKATFEIYDAIGKLTHSLPMDAKQSNSYNLSVGDLAKGVYFFQIKYLGEVYTGKFVKE